MAAAAWSGLGARLDPRAPGRAPMLRWWRWGPRPGGRPRRSGGRPGDAEAARPGLRPGPVPGVAGLRGRHRRPARGDHAPPGVTATLRLPAALRVLEPDRPRAAPATVLVTVAPGYLRVETPSTPTFERVVTARTTGSGPPCSARRARDVVEGPGCARPAAAGAGASRTPSGDAPPRGPSACFEEFLVVRAGGPGHYNLGWPALCDGGLPSRGAQIAGRVSVAPAPVALPPSRRPGPVGEADALEALRRVRAVLDDELDRALGGAGAPTALLRQDTALDWVAPEPGPSTRTRSPVPRWRPRCGDRPRRRRGRRAPCPRWAGRRSSPCWRPPWPRPRRATGVRGAPRPAGSCRCRGRRSARRTRSPRLGRGQGGLQHGELLRPGRPSARGRRPRRTPGSVPAARAPPPGPGSGCGRRPRLGRHPVQRRVLAEHRRLQVAQLRRGSSPSSSSSTARTRRSTSSASACRPDRASASARRRPEALAQRVGRGERLELGGDRARGGRGPARPAPGPPAPTSRSSSSRARSATGGGRVLQLAVRRAAPEGEGLVQAGDRLGRASSRPSRGRAEPASGCRPLVLAGRPPRSALGVQGLVGHPQRVAGRHGDQHGGRRAALPVRLEHPAQPGDVGLQRGGHRPAAPASPQSRSTMASTETGRPRGQGQRGHQRALLAACRGRPARPSSDTSTGPRTATSTSAA